MEGTKLKEEIAASTSLFIAEQHREFLDAAWPRNPLDDPQVKYWRIAGRVTLLALLASSALQYYFCDVYLTIMALPRLTVVAALP
jgi:hypothetical protein